MNTAETGTTFSPSQTVRPLIGLTMGDAAGIGPEVAVRAALDERVKAAARVVFYGHPVVFRRAVQLIGSDLRLAVIGSVKEAERVAAEEVPCLSCCAEEVAEVPPGKIDARAGRAAHDALIAAAEDALRGDLHALTTAPLHKVALRLAGLHVPGHTEILAKLCGVDRYAMMLHLPADSSVRSPCGMSVVHVTLHTSLASVPELLKTEDIRGKIELLDGFLRHIGCDTPRIAVCALNPHAGENGLFGDEEGRIIAPAVEAVRREGKNVVGPLPADTLFRRAAAGEFDGVVAMYHDQGHIALKLLGFDRAVNITLGLPIIRTSPSHGTAFDIAGTGKANPAGMIEAVRMAARLVSAPLPCSPPDRPPSSQRL